MRNKITKENIREIDKEIEDQIKKLRGVTWQEGYLDEVKNLKALIEARDLLQDSRFKEQYQGLDTAVMIKSIFGLTSIILIMKYEKLEFITTKGFDIAKRIMGV